MQTVQCNTCLEYKEPSMFSLCKSKQNGLRGYCKACTVKKVTASQRTLSGLVKKIYHNQRMTTKAIGRLAPTYSEAELYEWMLAQNYLTLWQTWKDSDYARWLSPSIDRKDNTKSYSLDNIQLITWKANLSNQKKDNISGKYLHTKSKAVDQYTKEGEFIKSFPSVAIAMRELTGSRGSTSNITQVCTGKWKSAYGYVWKFSMH